MPMDQHPFARAAWAWLLLEIFQECYCKPVCGGLLSGGAPVGGQCLRCIGAQGVDVQPALARIAGIDREVRRLAALPDVLKDALHASAEIGRASCRERV